MWHTGKNPLKRVSKSAEDVAVVRGEKQRRLHKAFLRYHDPKNWPMLREALKAMGRNDLIGSGKKHLVPAWQPKNEANSGSGRSRQQKSALAGRRSPEANSRTVPPRATARSRQK